MNELKTKRFANLGTQEQLSERIWHLENSVIEQRVEETEVRETLTEARLELKGLKDRWRTLTSLIDHEQHWIETMGTVSEWVWLYVSLYLSRAHTARSTMMCSQSWIL